MIVTGSIPSPRNPKDFISTAIIPQDIQIKPKVSWLDKDTVDIYQGNHPICVGASGAGIKNIHETMEGTFVSQGFSPLFLYTMCKAIDGIPDVEGTFLSTAMEVLRSTGIIPEKDLPLSTLRSVKSLPTLSEELKAKGVNYKISAYAKIPNNISAVKQALEISPIMLGLQVYANFANNVTGFIRKPNGFSYGGHAVRVVGYDDTLTKNGYTGYLTFKNTWGRNWGDNGIGYLPYDLTVDESFVYEIWSCVDSILKKKYHKIQVGAYRVKENAQKMVEKLKQAGYPTYLPKPSVKDGLYRVQTGAFENKINALMLEKELKYKGFPTYYIYE